MQLIALVSRHTTNILLIQSSTVEKEIEYTDKFANPVPAARRGMYPFNMRNYVSSHPIHYIR